MIRTYSVNENYFDKIDSEDKAYFLGLLYADGYNYTARKNNHFSLSLADEDVLLLFKKAIDSEHLIYKIKSRSERHSQQYRLQINSKKLCERLTQLGCVQNKGRVLTFPSTDDLPTNLIPHFVRGYFDGDGSAWEGKRKTMLVKDKAYKSGFRERIVHNVKFTITGSTSFITELQKILVKDAGLKFNKLNCSKNLTYNRTMEYSGRLQMKKFYEYIYKDATVFMKRKKDKFESIIICAST